MMREIHDNKKISEKLQENPSSTPMPIVKVPLKRCGVFNAIVSVCKKSRSNANARLEPFD
jgi:hypothetical protein